jgi:hypothetical protein
MWVYIQSEPTLWTVGHYSPSGQWHTDSDHGTQEEASLRCAWLNGSGVLNPTQLAAPALLEALEEFVRDIEAAYPPGTSAEPDLAGDWPDLVPTYAKARTALAKAKGE